jgi:acyl carrier protein
MGEIQQSIKDDLGLEVPMDELFRRSTVAETADYLSALSPVT